MNPWLDAFIPPHQRRGPPQYIYPSMQPAVIPPNAQMLQRWPEGLPHGFPHPGYLGSNAPLAPGRDNPFAGWGGPAPAVEVFGAGPAGGMSLPAPFAQTPEELADLRSPFQRTSILGRSVDILPGFQEEVIRAFTKSQIGPIPMWISWSIRPNQNFTTATDTLDGRVLIEFGVGGSQLSRVVPDIGSGSMPLDGAAIPEPTTFGGFGGSIIVHGTFVRVVISNVGTSTINNPTTYAAIVTEAKSGRNDQPEWTTIRASLAASGAAGDSTTIGIPPFSSHVTVYRTNSGATPFLGIIRRYLGGFADVFDFPVAAGVQMTPLELPNGSSRLLLQNLGVAAASFNVMFRLNP